MPGITRLRSRIFVPTLFALLPALLGIALCSPAALHGAPADRQVAEWTIRMGGRVQLTSGPLIGEVSALPPGDFELAAVNLVGCSIDPADLSRLGGLEAITELHLPGPMWNPRSSANKNQSEALAKIAGLTTLETLTFSYSFLAYIRFFDEGFEQIAALKNLKEIRVRRTKVRGHSLAPFTNLEALDLSYTPLDDEGLGNIEAMTGLKKLWIGDTLVTDEGMRPVGRLTQLEELNLGGTGISDTGLEHLKGLRKLKKLDLLGADISDAGLAHLSQMKGLEVLNLYRTKVSNAGLGKLAGGSSGCAKWTSATPALPAPASRTCAPPCRERALCSSISRSRRPERLHRPRCPRRRTTPPASVSGSAAWVARRSQGTARSPKSRSIPPASPTSNSPCWPARPISEKLNLAVTEIGDLGARHLAPLARLERTGPEVTRRSETPDSSTSPLSRICAS